MSYSVVILHHNKAAYSRACLESVLRSVARPLQIINVDNGCTDETAVVLKEFAVEAQTRGIDSQILSFDANIGAVRGRNEALKAAGGQYIAFLDNDTLISQANWLEKLAQHLESRPDCAVVCPKLLFPWSPYAIECCGCAISAQGRIQYLGRGEARDAISDAKSIQAAISAAWLMQRALIEQIGDLDEAFSPVQYEDLDFCYRARAAGFSIWTAPDVELFHFEHTTTAGSGDINFAYVTAKNGLLFKKRWGARFAAENGPSEEAAAWQTLPKKSIEEVDWRQLLPADADFGAQICKQAPSL